MACKIRSVGVIASLSRTRLLLSALSTSCMKQEHCLSSSSQQSHSFQPPRKPAGAFLKFRNARLSEIVRQNPDLVSLAEQSKVASQLWHSLDQEERNRLKVVAKQEMKEYRQKYSKFLEELTVEERLELMQRKHSRKEALDKRKLELQLYNRPKKPPNSFNLFVRAARLQLGKAEPPNFLKDLVRDWRLMPQKEKAMYQKNAEVEKERYEKKMDQWERRMMEIGRADLMRRKSQLQSGKLNAAGKASKADSKPV